MLEEIKGKSFYNEVMVSLLFLYLGTIYFSFAIPNILIGAISAWFLFGMLTKRLSFQFDKKIAVKYMIIIVPFLLTILSVTYSDNMSTGVKHLTRRVPIVAISFIIICTQFEDRSVKIGAKLFMYASIVAAVLTVYKGIKYSNEGILFQTEFTHFITIIQHPYFGIYVLIALILMLELKLIKQKWLLAIISVLFVTSIALSTSRLVYLLLLMYSIYFVSANYSKQKVFGFSIVAILGIIVLSTSNHAVSSKFKSLFDYKTSPRLQLWNNALKVVDTENAYVFGIGIGDYYETKIDPYFAKGRDSGIMGYNPHSQFVEFYITNGIFGISLIILSIVLLIAVYLKKQKLVAYFLFFIVFLFSFTECIFTRQYGIQLYAVLIPLILKENFKKIQI